MTLESDSRGTVDCNQLLILEHISRSRQTAKRCDRRNATCMIRPPSFGGCSRGRRRCYAFDCNLGRCTCSDMSCRWEAAPTKCTKPFHPPRCHARPHLLYPALLALPRSLSLQRASGHARPTTLHTHLHHISLSPDFGLELGHRLVSPHQ